MKYEDIKTYEIGEHCFGEILKVNGIDYEDLEKDDIMEFILDMLREDNINSSIYLKEVFKYLLENVEADCIENHYDDCDQCGNPNSYSKYEV